jgi:hypothetical protein
MYNKHPCRLTKFSDKSNQKVVYCICATLEDSSVACKEAGSLVHS